MSIRDYLLKNHRYCDELFAPAEQAVADKKWDEVVELSRKFFAEMEHHFEAEEKILFPVLEERTGPIGPVMVMKSEHQQMRDLIGQMRVAVDKKDRDGYLGASETMMILMQQHNLKEEQILYPMCDQTLQDKSEEVITKMKEVFE